MPLPPLETVIDPAGEPVDVLRVMRKRAAKVLHDLDQWTDDVNSYEERNPGAVIVSELHRLQMIAAAKDLAAYIRAIDARLAALPPTHATP